MPYPYSLQDPPPAVIPNRYVFPTAFVQGDQFEFRVVDQDPYRSSDGWSFATVLRVENPGDVNQGAYQINSTLDAGDFLLEASAATTAQWLPARYQWFVYAIKGSDRETTSEGFIDILHDLRTATGDIRSHARRTLDLIEALIEGRATNDIVESTIDNTRFLRMKPADLLVAHSYYTSKVRAEEAKAKAKQGLGTGRNIYARFSRPL